MPIYEYRCRGCRKRVTILTLRVSETVDARCEHCGSSDLERLLSRFAMVRSERDRLDALSDDSALGDVDESDPKSMGRWMRKMGQEMGEDLGNDFDEMVDEIESDGAGGTDDDAGTDGDDG